MTLILLAPQRLALMLRDCHDSIEAAFWKTQEQIDEDTRPCFLVTDGDTQYPIDLADPAQNRFDETYGIEYIGKTYKALERDYSHVAELEARQVAHDAALYLLRRPNMQFSNQRGLYSESEPALIGVHWCRPTSRSKVTLMTRTGIDQPFWGFTMSVTIRGNFLESEDEVLI